MIDYKILQFSTAPQTGEEWFINAAQLMGLGPGFRDRAQAPFPAQRGDGVYRVSLVRHPISWLSSCYRTIKQGTTNGHLTPFRVLNHYCFESFVQSYLAQMPGGVGKLLRQYKADSCMRFEDLPWAFIELMQSFEIPEQMMVLGKQLRKPNDWVLPIREAWLRKKVMEAEREFADAYDYL